MYSSKIHVVYKKEVHLLYECECNACIQECKRREEVHNSYLTVPPSAAYLFGFIPSRQSQGSLARHLMSKLEEN